MTEEEIYMTRCIQLAKNGIGHVSPNPTVGAIIMREGKIIGEGYHSKYGCAHAEVNAINSVENKTLLKEATLYVSLEPCSHYGKTPPCADLIIEKQIPRVIIGCTDPYSKVSGRGIQKLRDAGVNVKVGVLEKECKSLIKRFIIFNTLQRPYIILKWAESADGFIDINRIGGLPVILSNPLTNMLVHKTRSEVNAIMVGTRTARLDNPLLNVRNWSGTNPLRIVLDRDLDLPKALHLFDNTIKTFVFTSKQHVSATNTEFITIDFTTDVLPQILNILYKRKIQTLMVEGGSILLQSFINSSLWDEINIEKTDKLLHEGIKSPAIVNASEYSEKKSFNSIFWHYQNKKSYF
jgi:riboflavin biosynthesis protein RibD